MSNSSLVNYKRIIEGHYNNRQGNKITCIVIHHCAGVLSVETLYNVMANKQASSTYGIGSDGRIAQYVDEAYRPWTTSGWNPDKNAITIEVSNSQNGGNWPVSDYVMSRLIDLCVDICKRNGIKKLYYDGKNGTLRRHCDYASTNCPGPYLMGKTDYICEQVNAKLSGNSTTNTSTTLYRVQVGAYKDKANATAQLNKIKAKGYDAIIVKYGDLYKVQIGAYSKKSNAESMLKKVKASGFDAFITTTGGTASSTNTSGSGSIVVGASVKIRSGAKDLNTGGSYANFVYNTAYKVIEVNGDRVVFGQGNTVIGAVSKSNIILQGTTATTSAKALKVGSKIKIKSGAKDLNTGTTYASFVYKTVYTVSEISEDRVVFNNGSTVMGAVSKGNVSVQ